MKRSFIIVLAGMMLFFTAADAGSGTLGKLLNLISGAGEYQVARGPSDLPGFQVPVKRLDIDGICTIRALLESRQFEALNRILDGYQKDFEADRSNEYLLFDAYRAFDLTLPSYAPLLKAWRTASPSAYYPFMASARYTHALAWEKRGNKYISATPKENIEGMRIYFAKALGHLNSVLNLKTDLLPAHELLVGIYDAGGNSDEEELAVKTALSLFPDSFLINTRACLSKLPRWGGSYKQMESMAKNAEAYWDMTPELCLLYGFIYYDQGRYATAKDKPEKAVRLFNKALAYGEHWVFYYELAKVHLYHIKDFDTALDHIDRSIELRPAMEDNRLMRSRILFALDRYDDAIVSLKAAQTIRPGNPDSIKWAQWACRSLVNQGHNAFKTDLDTAVDFYHWSLEFKKDNHESYYWRGVAQSRMNRFESALSDIEKSIEINPRHFESYRMIDYLYARNRQWETIIGYWNRFLALEPDHALAYFERSGTHYHNKNMDQALADLDRACELGHEKACQKYKQVSSQY
ncbi:MAG: tetratricopeptide repeat protein [Desulfobacter sp.]|nr:MAG: tetratricopeptide repeat protein [Desulfobacter sp.]